MSAKHDATFILMVRNQLRWADGSQARVLDGPSMQLASAGGPYEVAFFKRPNYKCGTG